MPIVFSAIVPHPPILVPAVGKENINLLKATKDAFLKLEHELYASQPETAIVISPHGNQQERVFTINASPEFKCDFEKFGDLATKFSMAGDTSLAHKIKEKSETEIPLQMISEENLDHGSSIPLYLLAAHLPKLKIIPIYHSGLDLAAHYNFGKAIKDKLSDSNSRVAIISSGDLSHRLSENAPAGYSPKGEKFDKKLIGNLLKKQTEKILELKPEFIAEAGECGLKSIVILLGILDGIKYKTKFLSYESPFGVGYLIMNFEL